ncbi:MAG: hypothetical protein SFX74_12240 [Fimbriimonadaceae bacterium]|nr:hypothetical protein [Fimbriimonadaceae bacterium]
MFPIENMALMIPILALSIPIIAILVSHQQKMARILADRDIAASNMNRADIQSLRAELNELKQLVHQQAITIDNLTNAPFRSATPTENVYDRR